MALLLNKPKIIANEQRFDFTNISIDRSGSGELSAKVSFNIFNEAGSAIGSETLYYEKEDFNAFWSKFTSGTFLYQELATKYNTVLSDDKEADFLNVEAAEPVSNNPIE